jgi:hypothetical protein
MLQIAPWVVGLGDEAAVGSQTHFILIMLRTPALLETHIHI